jgi:DNA-binding MarR family transcriptional regulator
MPSQLLTTPPPHLSPGKRSVLAALIEFPDATVIAVADAAQVGRSSAAAALTMLERCGLAVRRPSGLVEASRRPPDLWSATPAAAHALAEIPPEPSLDGEAVVEPPLPKVADEEVARLPEPEPVETAPTPLHDETTATSETTSRLGKGMLREAVRQHLRTHSEATFTPTALSKVLGRSGGAIANALDALVADGEASMVLEKPRTFRAKLPA